MLHGPPSDESFPTIYAPSWRCITYGKSSATMTYPIRSLFVYYVWFTVVYQGKSLVAWEGASHLSSLSPPPFPPRDLWPVIKYDVSVVGSAARKRVARRLTSALQISRFSWKNRAVPLCSFSLRDELPPSDIPRSYLKPYCRLLRRYESSVLIGCIEISRIVK